MSIVTPFLDGQHFFEEAIQSILSQTFEGWEVLLIDDGSTDVCPMGGQYNSVISPPTMLLRQIEKTDGLPAPSTVLLRTAIAVEV